MALDEAGVSARVAEELAGMTDARLVTALRGYLVPPRRCELAWDYGPPEGYPGFVVAEFPESGTGIAFSEHGFGPRHPWVLSFLERPGFGMDSGAFARLEGAFRDSMAWDEPPPPGYEVE
ncbi:MAG TPA: hypothetical protein VE153_10195 [Myxococcus sp.]|nr:hypothetical protein [Myxococcus sp.]